MPLLDQLASALGTAKQDANVLLAQTTVAKKDKQSVKELIELLHHPQKKLQHDSIKVLYEIGAQEPELIGDYADDFIALLDSKDNRMQWGAMTAIDAVTQLQPAAVYKALKKIVDIADGGSVITRDHFVSVLVTLAGITKYYATVIDLLLEQMHAAPLNQFPMYAERAYSVVKKEHAGAFAAMLTSRLKETEQESKRKRILKILSKINY